MTLLRSFENAVYSCGPGIEFGSAFLGNKDDPVELTVTVWRAAWWRASDMDGLGVLSEKSWGRGRSQIQAEELYLANNASSEGIWVMKWANLGRLAWKSLKDYSKDNSEVCHSSTPLSIYTPMCHLYPLLAYSWGKMKRTRLCPKRCQCLDQWATLYEQGCWHRHLSCSTVNCGTKEAKLSAEDIPRNRTVHLKWWERPSEGGDLETCLGKCSKNTGCM